MEFLLNPLLLTIYGVVVIIALIEIFLVTKKGFVIALGIVGIIAIAFLMRTGIAASINIGLLTLLIPIGLIGIYRWASWITRYALANTYRSVNHEFSSPVSVIIPVFNEDPNTFEKCLESVLWNQPDEVIVVIQRPENQSFDECVDICKRYDVTLIVTDEYGKRPALAEGIKAAKNEIVALVDSDVIWSDNLLESNLKPFADERVGAVMAATRALNPHRWHQRLMDLLWQLRNRIDFPLMARFGSASVVSGRTAFYRRQVLLSALPEFFEEEFLGVHLKSGDDKFFTRKLMKTDLKVAYQYAEVFTEVPEKFSKFLKQYLRWQRNSWRSDIKLLGSTTTFNRPPLAIYLADRWIGKFAVIYGVFLAGYSIASSLLTGSIILLALFAVWWMTSRILKLSLGASVLSKTTLMYVPWVVFGAFASLWSLITIRDTGWHTRTGWKIQF